MTIDPQLSVSVISFREKIEVSSKKLWSIISSPENLNYCHPFCKKNTVKHWPGKGSEDVLEYYNGLILQRHFTLWKDGIGYELLIGNGKIATAKVVWTITEITRESSELSITINILADVALRKYPKPSRWFLKKFYFLPNMSKYVKAVVQGFKFYAETGIPVEKNQFGYNQLFSTRTKIVS